MLDNRKSILKKKTLTKEDEHHIDDIEKEITGEIADKEFDKLEKVLGNMETDSGETDYTNIWKEMRKAYPKKSNPLPTGVRNVQGKVITNPKEKKNVTLEHFTHRMRKRKVKDEIKEIEALNTKLFKKRLNETKNVKSPPFEISELNKVLKSLKSGKSKDPDNYICELFKEGVIGKDLKKSILLMMNKMKKEMSVPDCLRTANITILHKKSCKLDLNNWRGIFVCSVLRTILMKLVQERTY